MKNFSIVLDKRQNNLRKKRAQLIVYKLRQGRLLRDILEGKVRRRGESLEYFSHILKYMECETLRERA